MFDGGASIDDGNGRVQVTRMQASAYSNVFMVTAEEVEGGFATDWNSMPGRCAATWPASRMCRSHSSADSTVFRSASVTCPDTKELLSVGARVYGGAGQVALTTQRRPSPEPHVLAVAHKDSASPALTAIEDASRRRPRSGSAGFVALLTAAPDVPVVGEAGQDEEAVRLVRATHPDVVLMDVRMPVLNGVGATVRITADPPALAVVMLTTFGLDEYVFGALRAGATGFLLKDTPPDEVFATTPVPAAREHRIHNPEHQSRHTESRDLAGSSA